MARKGASKRKELIEDPIYGSVLVSKFINYVMTEGKKSVAEKLVYKAFDLVKQKLNQDPLGVFERVVQNVSPEIEVRSKRVGGATYQVPVDVRAERALSLALRWLVDAAKSRAEKTMQDKLGGEIVDAYNNRGGAVTTRENKRKMAESNKAFAHYRW